MSQESARIIFSYNPGGSLEGIGFLSVDAVGHLLKRSVRKAGRNNTDGAGIEDKVVGLWGVQQRQATVVTTKTAAETIIENPLLTVLEFNTDKAQAAWDLGPPLFDHPAQAPRSEPAVENLISHVEIGSGISHIHRPSGVSASLVRGLICYSGASWIEFDPFAFSPTSGESKTTDRDSAR